MEVVKIGRPAKSVATQSAKMGKEEREARLKIEQSLKGDDDNIIAPDYLTESQQNTFYYIKTQLEKSGILSNLDVFILSNTSIAIDRIQYYETKINEEQGKREPDFMAIRDLVKLKDSYVKDLNRYTNELSLSPQSRAKLASINFNAKKDEEDPLLQLIGGE